MTDRHRSQLMNYLLLIGLLYGKLVNLRAERITHEFVIVFQTYKERTSFKIDDGNWRPLPGFGKDERNLMVDAISDWGTGLDQGLYKDALVHFLGGSKRVNGKTDVILDNEVIAQHAIRLCNPTTAFKVTTHATQLEQFHQYAHSFS